MFANPSLKAVVGKFVAGLTVLAIGGGGGALLGIVDLGANTPAHATNHVAALGAPVLVELGDLVVEESPQPVVAAAPPAPAAAAAPAPAPRKVIRIQAPKVSAPASVAGSLNIPAVSSGSVNCDRLDDAKVQWLRRLVAKTKAANPGTEAVAGRIDAQLAGSLGRNMCATEAQAHLSNLCADGEVHAFMQKSVKELPFFVRPLVGDPCKQDIVAAAQKYLP